MKAAYILSALAAAAVSTNAFSPRNIALLNRHRSLTLSASTHLSEIEELCVENAAAYCLEEDLVVQSSECDLEEHEALVSTLSQQREYHLEQTHTIHELLHKLPDVGSSNPIRQHHVNEVDELCIENAAQYCIDNTDATECDLEEMEALVNTLQEQAEYHLDHVGTINGLLEQLQGKAPLPPINGLSA